MSLIVDIKKKLGSFTLCVHFESNELVTGIFGPSGSGKSMTLKCIAGIETPDSGFISLDGRVLFDSNRGISVKIQERRVGYLFQGYALFPSMTVKKNIMCGLCREKDDRKRDEKYNRVIKLLRIDDIQSHRPYQLSGGQAQRTAIARILVSSPDLLLLDEPFSAIDSCLKESIEKEILQILHTEGRQTLMVTHSEDEIRYMCTEIAVIKNGRVESHQKNRLL